MISLSILVGIISGIASALFMYGLDFFSAFLQGHLMSVAHPHPGGEEISFGIISGGTELGFDFSRIAASHWWKILLIPTLGGLISGWLVFGFAPEAKGHGIDAMIASFHNQKGKLRARVPFIKMLASLVTLSSGGSGGREGPIALIGGGFGSWISDRFGLRSKDRRHLLLAGAAGGVGSIFRAPLGGAISAIEILYSEDLETEALVPAVVSSVTAFSVFLLITDPLFGFKGHFIFRVPDLQFHPAHLIPCLVLAIVCSLLARIYVSVFHGIRTHFFDRLPVPRLVRPAIGGLMVGIIALLVPHTLGMGMGYIQEAISFDPNGGDLWLVARFGLVLLLLKMVTVSITIGSGGSAGVFGPSLLIGGLGGFVVGCVFYQFAPLLFPSMPLPPMAAFVILGMSAFFAAVANAPLGALVMSSEMTYGYELLAPLMLVSIIAMIYTRRHSIYLSQVKDKFHSPAHLGDISFDILINVKLKTIFRALQVKTIAGRMVLRDLRNVIRDESYAFPLVVKNYKGDLVGMLTMDAFRQAIFEEELDDLIIVKDIMTPIVTCALEDDLKQILTKFTEHGYGRLPVVSSDDGRRVIGYVRYQEIMEAYQREVARLKASD